MTSQVGYSRMYDEIATTFPSKTKCIDEILTLGRYHQRLFFEAENCLDICERNGIILNSENFSLAEDDAEFAGFEITSNTIDHIRNTTGPSQFSPPKNLTDVWSWFSLVNQVHVPSAWLRKCYHFESYSTPVLYSTGMKISTICLRILW